MKHNKGANSNIKESKIMKYDKRTLNGIDRHIEQIKADIKRLEDDSKSKYEKIKEEFEVQRGMTKTGSDRFESMAKKALDQHLEENLKPSIDKLIHEKINEATGIVTANLDPLLNERTKNIEEKLNTTLDKKTKEFANAYDNVLGDMEKGKLLMDAVYSATVTTAVILTGALLEASEKGTDIFKVDLSSESYANKVNEIISKFVCNQWSSEWAKAQSIVETKSFGWITGVPSHINWLTEFLKDGKEESDHNDQKNQEDGGH